MLFNTMIQAPIVTLHVSSEAAQSERRFDRALSIRTLKERLEAITGVSANTMKITAYNNKDQIVCAVNDDEKMLGYYPLEDYMRLHVCIFVLLGDVIILFL